MYRAVAAGREPERWVPLSTEARPFRLVATADAWIHFIVLCCWWCTREISISPITIQYSRIGVLRCSVTSHHKV